MIFEPKTLKKLMIYDDRYHKKCKETIGNILK